jgi:4-hydroxy-3-methylbut-2-enyl diphosphate reductase
MTASLIGDPLDGDDRLGQAVDGDGMSQGRPPGRLAADEALGLGFFSGRMRVKQVRIKTARHIGYCFGVRRAMNLTFVCLERPEGQVYSHGPLIHNQQALDLLASKGLKTWPPEGGPPDPKSSVIIRAHGLAPEEERRLRAGGLRIVDATCPRVAAVQRLVANHVGSGGSVLIWGTAGHPEVEGLLGYAKGLGRVIAGPEEVAGLPDLEDVLLVAQTTQDKERWPELTEAVSGRWPKARMRDTICQATVNRQSEARRLAGECGGLVIVGGRNSGNTRRLGQIGRREGLPTLVVEGPEEIGPQFVQGLNSVGLAAGASTPLWQIRSVRQRLEELGRSSDSSPVSFLKRLVRTLVLSNIYIGLGAGCLGLAMAEAVGCGFSGLLFGLNFFFVQFMHLLNALVDRASSRTNDPDRSAFLVKYRALMIICGTLSFALSVSGAYLAGPWVLAMVSFLTVCRILYNMPIPCGRLKKIGVRSLKDLPLAKTLAISAGWACLLALPPILSSPPILPIDARGLTLTAVSFVLVFLNLLSRTLVMDFQDWLGDRMFGSRTSVTLLGWRRASKLVWGLIALWALSIVAAYVFFLPGSPMLLLLIPGPLHNAITLRYLHKHIGMGGYLFDCCLDGQFLLSGLIVWAWAAA